MIYLSIQLFVSNHLKKVHAKATLNAGISTRNKTLAAHSAMVAAKAPKTISQPNMHANINANDQELVKVFLSQSKIKFIPTCTVLVLVFALIQLMIFSPCLDRFRLFYRKISHSQWFLNL